MVGHERREERSSKRDLRAALARQKAQRRTSSRDVTHLRHVVVCSDLGVAVAAVEAAVPGGLRDEREGADEDDLSP